MGLTVQEEVVEEESGYWLDIVLDAKASPLAPDHVAKSGGLWAVEVDGPSHFVRNHAKGGVEWRASGSTMLKRRHMEGMGHVVVSVPYWEWDELKEDEREAYLRRKLGLRR